MYLVGDYYSRYEQWTALAALGMTQNGSAQSLGWTGRARLTPLTVASVNPRPQEAHSPPRPAAGCGHLATFWSTAPC